MLPSTVSSSTHPPSLSAASAPPVLACVLARASHVSSCLLTHRMRMRAPVPRALLFHTIVLTFAFLPLVHPHPMLHPSLPVTIQIRGAPHGRTALGFEPVRRRFGRGAWSPDPHRWQAELPSPRSSNASSSTLSSSSPRPLLYARIDVEQEVRRGPFSIPFLRC